MTNQTTKQHQLAGAMKERGLTQRTVARLLDKPESTISNWSRGLVPPLTNQAALVTVLNDAGQDKGLPGLVIEDLWGTDA